MEHKTGLALAGAVVAVGGSGVVTLGTLTGALGPSAADVHIVQPAAAAKLASGNQNTYAEPFTRPTVRVTRYVDVPMPAPASAPAPAPAAAPVPAAVPSPAAAVAPAPAEAAHTRSEASVPAEEAGSAVNDLVRKAQACAATRGDKTTTAPHTRSSGSAPAAQPTTAPASANDPRSCGPDQGTTAQRTTTGGTHTRSTASAVAGDDDEGDDEEHSDDSYEEHEGDGDD